MEGTIEAEFVLDKPPNPLVDAMFGLIATLLSCIPFASVILSAWTSSLLLIGVLLLTISDLDLDNSGSGLTLVVPFLCNICLNAVAFSGDSPEGDPMEVDKILEASPDIFLLSGGDGTSALSFVFCKSEAESFSRSSSSSLLAELGMVFLAFKPLTCVSIVSRMAF